MSQNHGDRKRTGRFSLLSSLSSALIETSQRALEEHLHENTLQRRRGTAEAAPERLPGPAQQQQQQQEQQQQQKQQQQQLVKSDDPSGTEAIVAQAPPESPYASGDPAKLSISYLARISSEVYQSHDDRNETGGGGAPAKVHEVGTADCFSVVVSQTPRSSNSGSKSNSETKKTLCVAVRGTFSPLQHVMNVMPHAFRGLHVIGEALSSETRGCEKTGRTRTSRDAYREGHHEGWIEPARAIYQKLGELCLSSGGDWNQEFDRIVLTGHSRGGLLAVHVGEFFAGLRDPLRGGISGAEAPAPPFGGLLRVVAFGMPPPLGVKEDGGKGLAAWHACHVLSVWNKNDPVANGSVLNGGPSWKPLSLAVGSPVPPPKRQREFVSQPQPPQNHRQAKPPPPLGGWSGMLGALGSAFSTVAEAVGDTASDLVSRIEDHHPASEYALLVSEGKHGDPGELPGGVGVDPSSRELVLELL